MHGRDEMRKLLKPIVWDYDIDPAAFYEIAAGVRDRIGGITREKALIRMFERLSWYDLVAIFGVDGLKELLLEDFIGKVRPKMLRERYEIARQLLHRETISVSGWDPEYREKIQSTLLSNRWYRSG